MRMHLPHLHRPHFTHDQMERAALWAFGIFTALLLVGAVAVLIWGEPIGVPMPVPYPPF